MSGYTFTSSKPWHKCTRAQLLEGVEMAIEQRDKQIERADSNAERAQAAEAELAAARAENERLRVGIEQVRSLHRPWYEVNGVRHDNTVMIADLDLPDDHVCRVGQEQGNCDPDEETHYALACYECRTIIAEYDVDGYIFWPCPTARALLDGVSS